MAFALPNGARVFVQKTIGAALAFTGATNATEAVFTVADGTKVKVGDPVMIRSDDWNALDGMVAKVKAAEATKVTLSLVDTSNKNKYPAGAVTGKLIPITAWQEIPQITEVDNSGGEQQYVQVQFLSDDRQRNLATFKTAKTQVYTFAHDSSLPIYPVLRAADESGDVLACYMYVPKAKETRYWSATMTFDDQPQTAVNQVETVQASLSLVSQAMLFYKDAA
ncbi:tail fiber protein [Serratia phage vB_SlqS_ZDD2]|nr:tail fiber protein [Serratia phage vB_SlqS_ZDD2]